MKCFPPPPHRHKTLGSQSTELTPPPFPPVRCGFVLRGLCTRAAAFLLGKADCRLWASAPGCAVPTQVPAFCMSLRSRVGALLGGALPPLPCWRSVQADVRCKARPGDAEESKLSGQQERRGSLCALRLYNACYFFPLIQ